jgi:hypothetical protein
MAPRMAVGGTPRSRIGELQKETLSHPLRGCLIAGSRGRFLLSLVLHTKYDAHFSDAQGVWDSVVDVHCRRQSRPFQRRRPDMSYRSDLAVGGNLQTNDGKYAIFV